MDILRLCLAFFVNLMVTAEHLSYIFYFEHYLFENVTGRIGFQHSFIAQLNP